MMGDSTHGTEHAPHTFMFFLFSVPRMLMEGHLSREWIFFVQTRGMWPVLPIHLTLAFRREPPFPFSHIRVPAPLLLAHPT